MTGILVVVIVLLSIITWRLWVQSCELYVSLSECQDELLRRMRDEFSSDL